MKVELDMHGRYPDYGLKALVEGQDMNTIEWIEAEEEKVKEWKGAIVAYDKAQDEMVEALRQKRWTWRKENGARLRELMKK